MEQMDEDCSAEEGRGEGVEDGADTAEHRLLEKYRMEYNLWV